MSTSDTLLHTPSRGTPARNSTSSPEAATGDGFTVQEVQDALKPPPEQTWLPQGDYVECEIQDLVPGPRLVTFMGRVANIYDILNSPRSERSARGALKLCIRDDSGAITVRVWYAHQPLTVRLGTLVSVWATHVSNGEGNALASVRAPLFVSLFPERDRTCHLMVHTRSDDGTLCKVPSGFRRSNKQLSGLMTLKSFVNGGHNVVDGKVLVVVKDVGLRKKITRKDGTDSAVEKVNVTVQDDTGDATLGLWGTAASSPTPWEAVEDTNNCLKDTPGGANGPWRPGETVLLLESPGWKLNYKPYFTLTQSTFVHVDPDVPDSQWLRKWAQRQKSREAVNPPFPHDNFDLQMLKKGPIRCLYTIADLDEFARAAPTETFQGYLSVLLTGVKLFEHYRRRSLMSGECCDAPIFCNELAKTCKECGQRVALRLNPRIVGTVIDERGSVDGGKLLISDTAWQALLGRTVAAVLELDGDDCKRMSDRLLFCRVILLFGWCGEDSTAGGRICVLDVKS